MTDELKILSMCLLRIPIGVRTRTILERITFLIPGLVYSGEMTMSGVRQKTGFSVIWHGKGKTGRGMNDSLL